MQCQGCGLHSSLKKFYSYYFQVSKLAVLGTDVPPRLPNTSTIIDTSSTFTSEKGNIANAFCQNIEQFQSDLQLETKNLDNLSQRL